MNNPKYYTPRIEEFYIGFEYEWKEIDTENWNKIEIKDWGDLDCMFNNGDGEHPFMYQYTDVGIRTKHLDKEDIQSLGWEIYQVGMWDNTKDMFIKEYKDERELHDKIILTYNYVSHWMILFTGNNETPIGDWNTVFRGVIKNKSELIRILEMVK